MTISKYYDVVIIGASIAGLECARQLGVFLTVLVVDQKVKPGEKICAGGVTVSDRKYLSAEYFGPTWQAVKIFYKDKKLSFPRDGGIINSFDRSRYVADLITSLKKEGAEIILGERVIDVSDQCLRLADGRLVTFKYLVGADGASSITRKFLGLSVKRCEMAMQYIFPVSFGNFSIYLEDVGFSCGFIWQFPHPKFTSIGCGFVLNDCSFQEQKNNFDSWLNKREIDLSRAKFEVALINYDYRGYSFGNVYLAGEAAGLTSGFTGKGIYSALISGRQIAQEILLKERKIEKLPQNLIASWLRSKTWQERYRFFLGNHFLKKILFRSGIGLSRVSLVEKIVKKHLA